MRGNGAAIFTTSAAAAAERNSINGNRCWAAWHQCSYTSSSALFLIYWEGLTGGSGVSPAMPTSQKLQWLY
ncbi:hypothetical protein BDE02_07G081200 [Populus trichocarpa]|nr:hypothetical protein BDE02_07G081200 [Populus trichocarpa]